MTEHRLLARARRLTWLKMALGAMLPLGLCVAISRQASWKPRVLPGARANVFQVAFSPDGKYLAVAAQSGDRINHEGADIRFWRTFPRKLDDAVDVWDAQEHTLLHTLKLPGQVLGSIAFSPDGRSLAVLTLWDETDPKHPGCNEVKVWNVGTGKLERTLRVDGYFAKHLFWTGNLLTFSGASGIRQCDARTGKDLDNLGGCSMAGCDEEVALSRDGKMVAFNYGNVWLLDVKKMRKRRTMGSSSQTIARLRTFSDDSSLLASYATSYAKGLNHSAITIWDTESGAVKQTLRHSVSPRALALSPDNRLVAMGDDKSIHLRDVQTGALVRSLNSPARTLSFSPDGATLASGRGNGTFSLWRVK